MEQSSLGGVTAICAKESWTLEDYNQLLRELSAASDAAGKCKAALWEMEGRNPEPKGGTALKIGIARYMACRFAEALEILAQGTDNKDRHYFQALTLLQLRQYDKAIAEFERAKDRGMEGSACDLKIVEALALGGKCDEAEKALGKIKSVPGDSADMLYLAGLIAELRGFGDRAVESYVKAHGKDQTHVAATFRLAYHYDLHGNEDEAMELYRQCVAHPPVHANALLNMAVLHEDAGEYDKACQCLRRILSTNPAHPRARLFLKDAEASKSMHYDEDQARRLAKRNAVLDIPVTDFELSVRARNCLKKMNIRNLGDLVKTTEQDLLGYKNFGETSLQEIKDMLSAKSLRLGQALEEGSDLADLTVPRPVSVSNDGILATPLDHIEFSIRVRRALESLNITTLGELIAKTDAELLGCKNFGQTSLNEVRQRLAEYGLSLREAN
jgi:DNA-directed RNA polymerase subunit alpha